ncbi:hypothetical protein LC612_28920 [Nostoc sp. CHAB 5834]|nr:hypothetical protein [Nostoc sp. CHAB 5834]
MVKYNLEGLFKVTEKLLEKISHELGGGNTYVKQALGNVNKAFESTSKHKLKAEVEYKFTLEDILKDDDSDWEGHSNLANLKRPSKK